MCKAIDPVADVSSFDLLLNEIYNALIRLTVPKDLLIELIREERTELFPKLMLCKNPSLASIAFAGLLNMEKINMFNDRLDFFKLNIPPCFLNDLEIFSSFSTAENTLINLDIWKSTEQLHDDMEWVRLFYDACI